MNRENYVCVCMHICVLYISLLTLVCHHSCHTTLLIFCASFNSSLIIKFGFSSYVAKRSKILAYGSALSYK